MTCDRIRNRTAKPQSVDALRLFAPYRLFIGGASLSYHCIKITVYGEEGIIGVSAKLREAFPLRARRNFAGGRYFPFSRRDRLPPVMAFL